MKSSKKLQISSHLLFVYINNQDRKQRTSVLVFSSALACTEIMQYFSQNLIKNFPNFFKTFKKCLQDFLYFSKKFYRNFGITSLKFLQNFLQFPQQVSQFSQNLIFSKFFIISTKHIRNVCKISTNFFLIFNKTFWKFFVISTSILQDSIKFPQSFLEIFRNFHQYFSKIL